MNAAFCLLPATVSGWRWAAALLAHTLTRAWLALHSPVLQWPDEPTKHGERQPAGKEKGGSPRNALQKRKKKKKKKKEKKRKKEENNGENSGH